MMKAKAIAAGLAAAAALAAAGAAELKGPFPVMCTPWTADAKLDVEVLVREAEFLDECGVGGVIWPTAGEVGALVAEGEYAKGLEALAARAAKPDFKARMTFICPGADAEQALARVAEAKAAKERHGLKRMAILARPPDDAKTQEDMRAYYRRLAKAAPCEVIIQTYNGKSPAPEVKMLVELAKEFPETYGWVKEEQPGREVNFRMAQLVAAKPAIKSVFSGWGAKGWLYQGRSIGTEGIITQRPAYADLLVHIHRQMQNGDKGGTLTEAYSNLLLMYNLGDVFAKTDDEMRGPHLYVLMKRGVFRNTYTRVPAKKGSGKKWEVAEVKLTDREKREIDARLEAVGKWFTAGKGR